MAKKPTQKLKGPKGPINFESATTIKALEKNLTKERPQKLRRLSNLVQMMDRDTYWGWEVYVLNGKR